MIRCLSRIEMVCSNPEELAGFYQAAFGFVRSGKVLRAKPGKELAAVLSETCGGVKLKSGQQDIALIGLHPRGRPYPAIVAGWNPLFQHIAIVVSDMASAYAHLSSISGWTPISNCGPQVLPPSSGGVTAFKFRDPEGHPLELIAFAPGATPAHWQNTSVGGCLGIDHSAISISNTSRSVAFYQDLGLTRIGGSLNVGPEQAKLDDVEGAVVEVTALAPLQSTPHVELLRYSGDFDRSMRQAANDVTATRLVFSLESRKAFDLICADNADAILSGPALEDGKHLALLQDPDGHLIRLEVEK